MSILRTHILFPKGYSYSTKYADQTKLPGHTMLTSCLLPLSDRSICDQMPESYLDFKTCQDIQIFYVI